MLFGSAGALVGKSWLCCWADPADVALRMLLAVLWAAFGGVGWCNFFGQKYQGFRHKFPFFLVYGKIMLYNQVGIP